MSVEPVKEEQQDQYNHTIDITIWSRINKAKVLQVSDSNHNNSVSSKQTLNHHAILTLVWALLSPNSPKMKKSMKITQQS